MIKKKKKLISWVKSHKKELAIAGVSVLSIIAVIIGIKHKEELLKLFKSLSGKITMTQVNPQTNASTVAAKTTVATTISKPEILSVARTYTIPVIEEKARSYTNPTIPFNVRDHIRNLAPNMYPSAEKLATAAQHNFTLSPHQTWVNRYTKYACAMA